MTGKLTQAVGHGVAAARNFGNDITNLTGSNSNTSGITNTAAGNMGGLNSTTSTGADQGLGALGSEMTGELNTQAQTQKMQLAYNQQENLQSIAATAANKAITDSKVQ